MINILKNIISKYLTVTRGNQDISQTREMDTPRIRDIGSPKPASDSFKCPYCFSINFVRRGTRQKKLETVQLYLCNDCGKTFTPHLTKGKHYPLPTILDALAIYHLGYSLEETCRIVNRRAANNQQKTALTSGSLAGVYSDELTLNLSSNKNIPPFKNNVKPARGVDLGGVEPPQPDLTGPAPHRSRPTPSSVSQTVLSPSTLANWLTEFKDKMPFDRMRAFALKKYAPDVNLNPQKIEKVRPI